MARAVDFPADGIIGPAAMREAAAGELQDRLNLVRRALAVSINGLVDSWIDVVAMYVDRAVIRRDGRLFSYPYTIDDSNQVMIGTAEEVVQEHMPVALREALDAGAQMVEAKNAEGTKWTIRIIQAGWSGNRFFYPDAVLREAAPLFEGARVFDKTDEEHIKGKGKSFKNLIGGVSDVRFVEGAKKDSGELLATLDLLTSAGDTPAKMREAFDRGMAGNLFGFSIDVKGRAKRGTRGGRKGQIATSMTKVESVDLIIEPGAGGQLVNMIEAQRPDSNEDIEMSLQTRMVEAIKKANNGALPKGLDVDDEEALDVAYREALSNSTAIAAQAGTGSASPATDGMVSRDEMDQALRMVEARSQAGLAINSSGLPEIAKARLHKRFGAEATFTTEEVSGAITDEREYLAKFTESGHVVGAGEGSRFESGEDRADKVAKMLDGFFDPENRDVISFKECYVEVTGDERVTGHLRDCDKTRMREALGGEAVFREAISSGTWANALGDAITRRMVADYRVGSIYDVWRRLASVVPLNDFRTQERTRIGGYGNLPGVLQNGTYNALTSPTDEKATYAATKRGGTETVSLETIKNDDMSQILTLPQRLSRAAQRTLGTFVLDFLATNPTIYDSVALFHATHNNLGTAALDATSLAAGRLAMLKQAEAGSSARLGIPPRNLWVSADLEEAAHDLFRRTTNNDTDFVESLQMNVIPVWYWTDANDWVISADSADIPLIEIGFLDGNEEPELFVQDNPTQGSLFTNDQIKYKIRHIYGGNVLDYRGFYKGVVV
ncbi:MAG: hypothetical protein GXP10_10680 [Gammaproteobacteria bacterium]|nr:hypothetical protein [Gammaproteobacteria bacterium]